MKLDYLSAEAQDGLRRWSKYLWEDEMAIEDYGMAPAAWAWVCFLLRESEDRPEWFPKGKFATIQVIEAALMREARGELEARKMAR
jgi:hypothetical protein